jgi:hypothetical protein
MYDELRSWTAAVVAPRQVTVLRLAVIKKKTRMYVSVIGQSVSWRWIKSETLRVRNPEGDSVIHVQYSSIVRRVVEIVDFLLRCWAVV